MKASQVARQKLQLDVYRSLWGAEEFSTKLNVLLPALQTKFNGVECSLGDIKQFGRHEFVAALQDHDLKLIAGLYTSWDDYEGGYEHKSIQQHLDAYRSQLETALSLGIPPTKLNVHSGDDLWSLDQCLSFYEQAIRIEKEFGVQGIVMHETHRGRPFHNIQTTSAVLKHFPDDLYLTADFSHLMVTHERLLGFPYHSQAAAARRARRSQGSDPPMSTGDEGLLHTDQLMLELCKRSRHIHARVGQENAPQVYDPMSAEFRHHLRLYERWWDTIWEAQLNDGEKVFSLTPEYGPAPYTPSAPITSPHSTYNPITLKEPAPTSPAVSVSAPAVSRLSEQAGRGSVPVTSVWDIVNQQADRQRDRFEAWRARVAPSSAERSLPMIDISPFTRTAPCPTSASLEELEEHQQQKLECAKEMFHACKEVGFFYLTGHGVDDALYKGVNDQAAAFFQQDQAIKDRCLITNSQFPEAGRGYQRLAQNVTQEQRDWHEGFDFYRQLEDDHPLLQRLETLGEEERKRQTPMLRAKNVMPNYPPTFTPLLHRYVQEMNHLGSCVMRAIALGLELDEDHFTSQYIDDPFWVMRVINYPPLPSAALARLEGSCGDSKHSADSDMDVGVSCGEHSDYGCLTIVNQDEVQRCLQVRDSNNEWIYGNPISNAFVCNIGDMMQHWTGGLFKSTKHRVVNASGNQRISFPFFYEPNFDAEVRPQLSSPAVREHMQRQQEAGSETIVYGQHLMGKVYQNFDFDD